MQTRYFISSGSLNRMYTLRAEETTQERIGGELVPVAREHHVRNLSTDLATARAKAAAYLAKTGKSATVDTGDLDAITRGDRDPRIIYFGKYRGNDISVMPDDYAVFVYGSMSHAQFPAFWEQVAIVFADALIAAAKERKLAARREARAKRRAAANRQQMLDNAVWLDDAGRLSVTGIVTACFSFQTSWGYSTITKVVDGTGRHYLYWNRIGAAQEMDRVTFDCRVKSCDYDRDDPELRINVITRATKVIVHR
jgi:hypothetical protein